MTTVVVAVVGYVAWAFLRPDPYALSERITRDARREMAAEVRDFQRDLDRLMREARQGKADVPAQIDRHLSAALQGIDDVVDDSRGRLLELDIAIRTQRNRLDRIEQRAEEGRAMVRELAEEAKRKVEAAAASR